MAKAMLRWVSDGDLRYSALMFVCPGCQERNDDSTGLHMLPVNTTIKSPAWEWDGNLITPTLSPSILTGAGTSNICHSFLRAGIFEFLGDCTHQYANQHVPIPDLPDWVTREDKE